MFVADCLSYIKKERNCLSKDEKIQRFYRKNIVCHKCSFSYGKIHKAPVTLPCFEKVLQTASVELCRDLTKVKLENESKAKN